MTYHKVLRSNLDDLSIFSDSIEEYYFMPTFANDIADISTQMIQKVTDGLTELDAGFEVHEGVAGLFEEG
jgi:hypothetical protein